MSFLAFLLTLLFLGIAGYGLHAGILNFFLAGAVGIIAMVINIVTQNQAVAYVSFATLIGSLIYAAYTATKIFF